MPDFSLFSVIGIEIEYMLVDKEHLHVKPESDKLLQKLAGEIVNEVALGDIAISNEFVMHVIELKNSCPQPLASPLSCHFQAGLQKIYPLLAKEGTTLLPTAAHPWMNPAEETRHWPHQQKEIYQQYHTIFDCHSHGWANVQSMHVNLPFATPEEFYQLHNAVRLLLPLLPAIAASSPYLHGKYTGMQDTRLYFYERNQATIPAISGAIIPEFIHSQEEYQDTILHPMYQAIRPWDPQGILQHEWLNSRGAIAKFLQKAIEIRVIDTQECVHHDIAIAMAAQAVLQSWLLHSDYFLEHPCALERLTKVYQTCLYQGLDTLVEDKELLTQWQLPPTPLSMRDIWHTLLEKAAPFLAPHYQKSLEYILTKGNLSQRLLKVGGKDCNIKSLLSLYQEVSTCLYHNEPFL